MLFSLFTLYGAPSAIFSASENYFPVSPFHMYMWGRRRRKKTSSLFVLTIIIIVFSSLSLFHSRIHASKTEILWPSLRRKKSPISSCYKRKSPFSVRCSALYFTKQRLHGGHASVKLLFACTGHSYRHTYYKKSRLWLWLVSMSYDAVTTPNKRSREEGIKTLVVLCEMGKGERCVCGRIGLFIQRPFCPPPSLSRIDRARKKKKTESSSFFAP